MTQQYWVRGPTGQSGPFDQLQIRGLVAIGELMPTMEISSDAREWRIASSVRGLFPEPKIDPMEVFSASALASKVPGSAAQPTVAPVRPPPLPDFKPTPTARAEVNTAAVAPQGQPAATKPLSEKWQAIFAAFDKAGGLRFTNVRELSSTELRYVTFNPWAFLFGPFWYFAKGMWKRGLTIQFFVWTALVPLAVALIELLPNTLQVSSQLERAIPITAGAIFAAFANRDYYRFMRLGWRPSWKWLGISFATLIVVGGFFFLMPDEWTPRTSGFVASPQRVSTRRVPATPTSPSLEAAPPQAPIPTQPSQLGGSALSLKSLQLGSGMSADGSLVNPTSIFRPFDTIYAVANIDAIRPASLLGTFTYQGNQLVFSDLQQIAQSGPSVSRFHIAKADGFPTGVYAIDLTSDGKLIGRMNFEVR